MTAPTEPTPGAPAADPTPPNAQPGQVPPWERDGQKFDPERAWKLVESLRAENDKHKTGRQTAEQTATQAQARLEAMLKAAGLNPDGTEAIDPEAAAAQLAERSQAAESDRFRYAVESQLWRLEGRLGADVEALLDSNRGMDYFIDELDKVDGVADMDPRGREFAAAVEQALAATLQAIPRFKTTGQAPAGQTAPRPDPSQGARGAAPGFAGGNLTDAIRAHYAGQK